MHRRTDLLGTLTAYFANASNFARTARALHIHPNTLTKRIDRISSLLGHGWQQPEVVLNLQLAVRLHDLAHRVGALPGGETGGGPAPEHGRDGDAGEGPAKNRSS